MPSEIPIRATLTINAKRQVTLPKRIQEVLGVGPGDQLTVEPMPNHRVMLSPVRERTGSIMDTSGILHAYAREQPVSIEEMNEVIADGWAGKLES